MISIQDLTVRLGGKTIIKDLSWNIPSGAKAAIAGNNGAGKSTLLKAITGQVMPESGSITIPSGKITGYLPQETTDRMTDITVMSFLKEKTGIDSLEKDLENLHEKIESRAKKDGHINDLVQKYERLKAKYEMQEGYIFENRARKVMSGLGFENEDHLRNCRDFSGGWKMRLLLASVLLLSPDVLLLDEPTNHLDSESMEWLENWLDNFSGTMLVIAHDRRFLDKMVTETGDLGPGGLYVHKGNYSSFLSEREKRIETRNHHIKKQQKEIEKDLQFIDRFRYKASKASQVQSRVKKLDKMDILNEIEIDHNEANIVFPDVPRSGHEVLKTMDLAKSYEGRSIFSNINFSLYRGEKVALVGVNGAGKSTLMRLISGKEQPTLGQIRTGHNVKCAFFSQESSANLNYENTIWEEVSRCGELPAQQKRNLLGAFLFRDDDIHKKTEILSGGEKSRLALLKVLLQESNFLILDEATNHLDIRTKEIFLQALQGYSGTVLLVSHDRFFLDQLVERVIEIKNGSIRDYPGNYSYFVEKRKELDSFLEISASEDTPSTVTSRNRMRKKEEAELRNRLYQAKRKVMVHLEPVEEKIADIEIAIEKADKDLCRQEILSNSQRTTEIMIERSKMEEQLSDLMEQWENLMEKLHAIESEHSL